ncbi:MAG: molybdopterin-dependent oxidoreductase [Anaerolineales bacterium]
MSQHISRRDFLKLAGLGTAVTAVLTGCGPAARYVRRTPYTQMPEYTFTGQSTYFATTCRECPAGCGLIVRTFQGRAIKVEGNPNHPVNAGKTCARGQATLHGLYNPDRIQGPFRREARGSDQITPLDWNAAVQVVAQALRETPPQNIAFLLGMAPDHLFDLVSDLTRALNAPAPIRFGALGMFEVRATLQKATQNVFGQQGLPWFDLGAADVVFSFGANFLETWLSPVAYTRLFSQMRRGQRNGKRGYFVQFEPRMSQTASKADEWVPIRPGTEGLVALALGKIIAERRGIQAAAFANVEVEAVAEASGIEAAELERLATRLLEAQRALVIPGSAALAHSNGLENAEAILTLNSLLNAPISLSPLSPLGDAYHQPATLQEMRAFIERMRRGDVRVLFIHGVNPIFELPAALGFAEALKSVPLVISFATFPDETAQEADYVFPDHHALESWGYQRLATGSTFPALSGSQPVVVPFYNTQATADVLLAAAAQLGGAVAQALPHADEVAYLQAKLLPLVEQNNGFFSAPEINTFFAYFQQYGGWWKMVEESPALNLANALNRTVRVRAAEFAGEGEFHLFPFVSPVLGEAGANKPWLQEVPDPTTTVMWNSWIEINPKTAEELGLEDDDVVRVVSEHGSVEVPVYRYPAIRPDVVAIVFGQGHTAYGRYAQGRGMNPNHLLSPITNAAGDFAFAATRVRLEKTGKKQALSRLESRMGVYREGLGH